MLGVLEDAPEGALVRRLRGLAPRLQLGDRGLDLVRRPRREARTPRARRPRRGASSECRYSRPSSAGVRQLAPSAVDDERALEDLPPVAPVRARVHPDAAADRPRDRAGELEAAEPGGARAVEADRIRGAAAGARAARRRPRPQRARLRAGARAPRRLRRRPGGSSRARRRATPRPSRGGPARAPPRARRPIAAARTRAPARRCRAS